jgi:hypothetical protein
VRGGGVGVGRGGWSPARPRATSPRAGPVRVRCLWQRCVCRYVCLRGAACVRVCACGDLWMSALLAAATATVVEMTFWTMRSSARVDRHVPWFDPVEKVVGSTDFRRLPAACVRPPSPPLLAQSIMECPPAALGRSIFCNGMFPSTPRFRCSLLRPTLSALIGTCTRCSSSPSRPSCLSSSCRAPSSSPTRLPPPEHPAVTVWALAALCLRVSVCVRVQSL